MFLILGAWHVFDLFPRPTPKTAGCRNSCPPHTIPPPLAREIRPTRTTSLPASSLVQLVVLEETSRVPILGAHAALRPMNDIGPQMGASLTATTDEHGSTLIPVTPGLVYKVEISCPPYLADDEAAHSLTIAPILEGETRRVETLVSLRSTLDFWGRLLESGSDQPIIGSAVYLEVEEISNALQRVHSNIPCRTDPFGYFNVAPSSRFVVAVSLRIDSDTFGIDRCRLDISNSSRDMAKLIRMERSASLVVRVSGLAEQQLTHVFAKLTVNEDREPLEILTTEQIGWVAHSDVAGDISFLSVTPNVPLRLHILSGDDLVHEHDVYILLRPCEARTLSVDIGTFRIVGVLVDQFQRPVIGQRIFLVTQRRDTSHLTQVLLDKNRVFDIVKSARTDAKGQFALNGVTRGAYWLGPANPDSKVSSSGPVAPVARRVRVPEDAGTKLILQTYRGLYVEGRVMRSSGETPGRGLVLARSIDASYEALSFMNDDGSFEFGPLPPMQLDVAAVKELMPFEAVPLSSRVRTEAGAVDLLLHIWEDVCIVSGVVVYDQSLGTVAEDFDLRTCYPEGPSVTRISTGPEGSFEFESRPGLQMLVLTSKDGMCGIARIPIGQSGGLRVSLKLGARLVIRNNDSKEPVCFQLFYEDLSLSSGRLRQHTAQSYILPGGVVKLVIGEPEVSERELELKLTEGEILEVSLTK